MGRRKQITIYLEEDFFKRLKEKSKLVERSLNKYIVLLLKSIEDNHKEDNQNEKESIENISR